MKSCAHPEALCMDPGGHYIRPVKAISRVVILNLESMALVKHSDIVNSKSPCTVTARKFKTLNNLSNLP